MYDYSAGPRLLDGIMPFQEWYLGNTYIDVYNYFCRKTSDNDFVIKDVKQMYTTGLELQQKLDKIIDYDKCNPDTAKLVGVKTYCKQLFQT